MVPFREILMLPHRFLRCCLTAWMLALFAGAMSPASAQFAPNETLVSPHPGLIDFEFSQSRGRVAWTDPEGSLWMARVNRATGAFEPSTGRGTLIATGTVAKSNMFKWNGPEWLGTVTGDQLVYSYYLPGQPHNAEHTRMAMAVQDKTGVWATQVLSPGVPRMSHVASTDRGDQKPHIRYLDAELNHYWRDVLNPASETHLAFLPPSNRAWRFASGARALIYTAMAKGVSQVFSYQLDSGTIKQMTFDSGDKDTDRSVPWMWQAPEFDGDYVLSTVVNGSELRVYRKLPGSNGTMQWQPIYRGWVPSDRTIGSPEWFVYNGKSYLSMAVFLTPYTYPSEVWISNIEMADPLMRQVSDDTLFRVRNDPEVFVTEQGPYIYYNRYDPSVDPDHPLCNECSEGVFRADAGLWGR